MPDAEPTRPNRPLPTLPSEEELLPLVAGEDRILPEEEAEDRLR